MINAIVKFMYATEKAYCLTVGTLMTWAETAIDKEPIASAMLTALIIDALFM